MTIFTRTPSSNLDTLAWPLSRLNEAVEWLARRSGLWAGDQEIQPPPLSMAQADDDVVGRWLEKAVRVAALEIEAVQWTYGETAVMLQGVGPAILRLPNSEPDEPPRFLAILKKQRRLAVLGTDLVVHRVDPAWLSNQLWATEQAPYAPVVDNLIHNAGIVQMRQDNVRDFMLGELLNTRMGSGCWMLRLSPGASVQRHVANGDFKRPFAFVLGTHFIQLFLTLVGWWFIGRGALQGHFEPIWLTAWALLMFTTIPIRLLSSWESAVLSLNTSLFFKRRLLFGALQLNPEEVRHQGKGQFLSRVMESQAIESLVLSGGFAALMAVIDLISAGTVLLLGSGGWLHVGLLTLWALITVALCWRYLQQSRTWIDTTRDMTDDLVERMVGHRTRLAQERPSEWHIEEDQLLSRYLHRSETLDATRMQLMAFISRGWFIVGLAGLAFTFVFEPTQIGRLAVSVGGIFLAGQALGSIVNGISSITALLISWEQVQPLFEAAERPFATDGPSGQALNLDLVTNDETSQATASNKELIVARDLLFSYEGRVRPILQELDLTIHMGDRLLLEGGSGGGKSTLASLLVGLRQPNAGLLLLHGFDQQTVGADEWRRRIISAPQFHENHVLTETFAFNLLMGRRWPPTEEDLAEAGQVCQELGLGDLLQRMPAGFQQMVGESGWQLSHGERSRLFIARALLQQADMIVLDESFAALDPENLQMALECVLRRAKTLLVIAHP
ncbi:MAG: ABC transporter ATP-binding protein [Chloroflexota bacterium]